MLQLFRIKRLTFNGLKQYIYVSRAGYPVQAQVDFPFCSSLLLPKAVCIVKRPKEMWDQVILGSLFTREALLNLSEVEFGAFSASEILFFVCFRVQDLNTEAVPSFYDSIMQNDVKLSD